MATRKRATPKRKGRARSARPAAKKTAARAKAPAARRKAPAARRKLKQRQDPETLRLRGFEPSLTANDLQESIRFYTDVLGFFMGERWVEGGVLRGVTLKAGVCRLGLSQDDWKKGRDRRKGEGIRLYCKTAQDVDALAARIRSAGGRLVDEPHDQMGGRALTVADPDGFLLTIYKEK
jgi:catechol 2,3-dioxygenase-like lactoylglutathione lyase family enzyme